MGVHSKLAKEDKSAAAKAPSNLLKKLLPVRASTFATRNIWDIGTDDKKYICELAETTKEKAESAGEKFSERAFAGTYNIKPSTLRRWIVKYLDAYLWLRKAASSCLAREIRCALSFHPLSPNRTQAAQSMQETLLFKNT
jgi:hypothetical protein